MHRLVWLFGWFLLLGPACGAKPGGFSPSAAPERAAIEQVILGQLAAFRAADFPAARAAAAAALQEKFPAAEFEQMVRRGYPRVARNRAGRLGEVLDDGQRALARVTITDPDGTEAVFRYVLLKETAGWRISGLAEAAGPKNDT